MPQFSVGGEAFTVPDRLKAFSEWLFEWFPVLIVIGLWEFASGRTVGEAVLPPPSVVFVRLYEMITQGDILFDLGISIFRVLGGLTFSISIGVMLGVSMARSDRIENMFDIFLALIYPVPKIALIPIAILWFGAGTTTVVFVIFLGGLLPIILNTYNGTSNIDQELIWSGQMVGLSDRALLWKIVIPSTIPNIMTGIRQAIPIAFIGLIGAELLAAREGVGSVILRTGELGDYPSMFSAILLITIVAYIAVRGFEIAEPRVVAWT